MLLHCGRRLYRGSVRSTSHHSAWPEGESGLLLYLWYSVSVHGVGICAWCFITVHGICMFTLSFNGVHYVMLMERMHIPGHIHYAIINTYTARPGCWSGWISDSYCSLKPLCSGMGEVVPARTSPTLLPPSPRTVLSLSCFKVSQCINCCDWYCKS